MLADVRSFITAMTFRTQAKLRCFEDYRPGAVREFGCVAVEATEAIAFVHRFNPQPFHTDPESAV